MIYHIWRHYPARNRDEQRRNALAKSSWPSKNRTSIPVEAENLPRLFEEPPRALPFVRDVFNFGVRGLPDDAMMLFTPTDIGLSTHALASIELALSKEDAGDGNRHLFPGNLTKVPSDAEIASARQDYGKGMWFFRAGWWRKVRRDFPDMILPRTAWDWMMKTLIKETSKSRYIELPGLCWHQEHQWLYHDATMFGNRYNIFLARQFLHEHKLGHLENHLLPAAFGLRWNQYPTTE